MNEKQELEKARMLELLARIDGTDIEKYRYELHIQKTVKVHPAATSKKTLRKLC
jgi:hypothetical protein